MQLSAKDKKELAEINVLGALITAVPLAFLPDESKASLTKISQIAQLLTAAAEVDML